MKKFKFIIFLGIFVLLLTSNFNHSTIVSRAESQEEYTTSKAYKKKYIKVKILSASSKKIKIKMINNGDKTYRYSPVFTVKRKQKDKWKKIKFGQNAMFPKCLYTLEGKSSKTVTIKWKSYYDHNLPKGTYRIIWISSQKFKIK